jgi:hypothetical protein
MPIVGLVVEGVYDEAAISVFAKRCRKDVNIVARICRGTVTGRFRGIVAELHRSYRPERILIVSDSDGQDPAQLMHAIRRRLTTKYRFPVIPLVIVEELEAWLIADPLALERFVGVRKNFPNPEEVSDPKAELRRLFSVSAYTSQAAAALAAAIDLDVLRRRCPRFRAFDRALQKR